MRYFLLVCGCALMLSGPASAITVVVHSGLAQDCYLATLKDPTPENDRQAIAVCTQAVANSQNDEYDQMAALVNRADVRLRMSDFQNAAADSEQALLLEGDQPVAHLNRGAALVGLRRYPEAIAALDRAIALNIQPLQVAYFNRALAKEALGDVPGAYHDYKAAVDLDPKFQLAAEELSRFTVIER